MNTLFPNDPVYPPGFSYIPEFIGTSEEAAMLGHISTISLHTFIFQGFEAKRRVASFGYDYSFDKRSLSVGKAIPPAFDELLEKVSQYANIRKEDFGELLITEYPVRSVINWHRDAPPFEVIIGLSLSADCTFRFRPHDKEKQTRKSIISLPVRRRSLYIIRDEARTHWEHSILPVKEVRYSITLRTLRIKSPR